MILILIFKKYISNIYSCALFFKIQINFIMHICIFVIHKKNNLLLNEKKKIALRNAT